MSFYVVLVLSEDSLFSLPPWLAIDVYIMYFSVTYDFSHTTNYLWCALLFMVIKYLLSFFYLFYHGVNCVFRSNHLVKFLNFRVKLLSLVIFGGGY